MKTKEILLSYVSAPLRQMLCTLPEGFFAGLEEIRLRIDKPLLLRAQGRELTLGADGRQSAHVRQGYRPAKADIEECVERMSHFSLYALEEELKKGYLTLPGGHRVGIAGKVVQDKNGVKTIQDISGLNIRVSHQVIGAADGVLPLLLYPDFGHTLIISPPGCGKTTLLRDLVRQLSDGGENRAGVTVGLVDERSEIAGCYKGIPQNDVGLRTDVLDGCPKAEGMVMLLRAMAPWVIAVDEIGSARDVQAMEDIVHAGVRLLCTAHGSSLAHAAQTPWLGKMVSLGIFKRYVVLDKPGRAAGVFDAEGNSVSAGLPFMDDMKREEGLPCLSL